MGKSQTLLYERSDDHKETKPKTAAPVVGRGMDTSDVELQKMWDRTADVSSDVVKADTAERETGR